jgi:hypothetical protein
MDKFWDIFSARNNLDILVSFSSAHIHFKLCTPLFQINCKLCSSTLHNMMDFFNVNVHYCT